MDAINFILYTVLETVYNYLDCLTYIAIMSTI